MFFRNFKIVATHLDAGTRMTLESRFIDIRKALKGVYFKKGIKKFDKIY